MKHSRTMDWNRLLSSKRLGKNQPAKNVDGRSPYQVDFDRLIFSPPFRRLQDKTQVFPLAESDYVRTRLTHSLEVSCIGRSLGTRIGKVITQRHNLKSFHASDFGSIVAAACLAHDLGNPPFGHSGEDAIRHWFLHSKFARSIRSRLSKKQKADIENYEGNAQGFRLVTYLQMPDNRGGMQLTSATLAAFTKYPVEATLIDKKAGASRKKYGFFQAEKDLFNEVADETGLVRKSTPGYCWCRHPLAYVVEAADDITYRIIDYEDGYKLGLVPFRDIQDRFTDIIKKKQQVSKLSQLLDEKSKVEYLRSKAFEVLIQELTDCFLSNELQFLNARLDKSLVELIPSKNVLEDILSKSRKQVYADRRIVEIEAAGFEVATGLLDLFVKSADDFAKKDDRASAHSKKYLQLVPNQFLKREKDWNKVPYVRLMSMLDFFCGMTDSYAVSLFKKVRGISLPDN